MAVNYKITTEDNDCFCAIEDDIVRSTRDELTGAKFSLDVTLAENVDRAFSCDEQEEVIEPDLVENLIRMADLSLKMSVIINQYEKKL